MGDQRRDCLRSTSPPKLTHGARWPLDETIRDMQCSDLDAKASRREFLRATTRYASLVALAGAAASLFARRRVDATGCEQNRFCADCARLSFCRLPPAPAARLAARSPKS